MRRKWSLGFVFSSLLVFSIALVSCNQNSRQATAAVIKGNAEIVKVGETVWQPLKSGTAIAPGDVIRTGDDSLVNIEISDGSLVGITSNAEIELVTLSKQIKNPETVFDLKDGLVYVKVTRELGKGSFKIKTPVLTGSVVGSQMSVQYIPSLQTADVACFEGNINAEFTGDVTANPTSSHLIDGVKLSATSQDEVTVKKCQHPVKVSRLELQAYSDWEEMSLHVQDMIKTEAAQYATQTKVARFTKTPTLTPVLFPTDTPEPTNTPLPTGTSGPKIRPTITVDPDAPLSPEEEFNLGTHDYSYTAQFMGNCSGQTSGNLTIVVQIEGNQVTLSNQVNKSMFSKVDDNTYQGFDNEDFVTFSLTKDGFVSEKANCYIMVFTLIK